MAAMKLKNRPAVVEPAAAGSSAGSASGSDGSKPSSPVKDSSGTALVRSTAADGRGRELAVPDREEKQVRLVSPPRNPAGGDGGASSALVAATAAPIRGILKQPSAKFPEEANPVREGVAPHKEDKKLKEVPDGARWTKILRKIVNPEALTIGKERFEVRDDFVIVLRVLSKEEIQAYAAATTVLRGEFFLLSFPLHPLLCLSFSLDPYCPSFTLYSLLCPHDLAWAYGSTITT